MGEAEGLAVRTVATPGDNDQDGLDDLLVTAWPATTGEQAVVSLLHGPLSVEKSLGDAAATFVVPTEAGPCDTIAAGVGDLDGDGFGDVAVSAPGFGEGGAVFILSGPP